MSKRILTQTELNLLKEYGWTGNYEPSDKLFNILYINAELIKALKNTKYMVVSTESITKFVLKEAGIKRQLIELEVKPDSTDNMLLFCNLNEESKQWHI